MIAIVFGVLWAREATARDARRATSPSSPSARDAATATAAHGRAAPAEPPRVPRSGFLEGVDARPRRRDRRPSSRCRSPASRSCRRSSASSSTKVDLGPISNFPLKASGTSRPSSLDPDAGRGLAGARPSSATTADADPDKQRAGAELHDHLEPLRPPRLPGAGERADRTEVHRQEDRPRAHAERPGRARSRRSPPATAARATAASTTPRATAPPARPCARSTATTFEIDNGRLDPPQPVLRLACRRHRRAGADPQVQGGRPGRARRRPRADASIPSSRRTTRWPLRTTTDEGRAPPAEGGGGRRRIRSTGSRSGRGSSAASSTSSSATSHRTSTGCRRSDPPRSPRSSCRRSPA